MRLVFICFCWMVWGCMATPDGPSTSPAIPATALAQPSPVKTGAQVLAERSFSDWQGRNVGLIVNHTALVGDAHLADLVHEAADVSLVALFGPEHGLRGTAEYGASVVDGRDAKTGVPIYSLYGRTRKPTPAMLEGIDLLVFDIQDIGARFYTYISTMGLAMQAAAEARIPFVVLDRPNPLGGTYVSGFMMEPAHTSFVGQFAIPIAHGLTVGELARMIKGEALLPGLASLELHVVSLENWTRTMTWEATQLPWTPPSPNIPDIETAWVYPGTCFFEATGASEGRGTLTPFRLLGAPWVDGEALTQSLNARTLPGIRFSAATFTPTAIEQMATNPKLKGQALQGIRLHLTDPQAFQPVETGVYVLHAFYQQAQAQGIDLITRKDWLANLSGTHRLYDLLTQHATPETIIAAWQAEVEAFRTRRAPYLLYESP